MEKFERLALVFSCRGNFANHKLEPLISFNEKPPTPTYLSHCWIHHLLVGHLHVSHALLHLSVASTLLLSWVAQTVATTLLSPEPHLVRRAHTRLMRTKAATYGSTIRPGGHHDTRGHLTGMPRHVGGLILLLLRRIPLLLLLLLISLLLQGSLARGRIHCTGRRVGS